MNQQKSHLFAGTTETKHKCHLCNCENYPDCEHKGESCEECVDGAGGFHLLMHADGRAERDTPDEYRFCQRCEEYVDPEDDECQVSDNSEDDEDDED